MMEPRKLVQHTVASISPVGWPANENPLAPAVMGRSIFPQDAIARISKPSRSVMTSGKARIRRWRLSFEKRRGPGMEPLMGWTGGDDMMSEVELEFPTLESAIRHAQRQGLTYVIEK